MSLASTGEHAVTFGDAVVDDVGEGTRAADSTQQDEATFTLIRATSCWNSVEQGGTTSSPKASVPPVLHDTTAVQQQQQHDSQFCEVTIVIRTCIVSAARLFDEAKEDYRSAYQRHNEIQNALCLAPLDIQRMALRPDRSTPDPWTNATSAVLHKIALIAIHRCLAPLGAAPPPASIVEKVDATTYIDRNAKVVVHRWTSRRQCRMFQHALRALSQARHDVLLPQCFAVPFSVCAAFKGQLVTATWLPPLFSTSEVPVHHRSFSGAFLRFWRACAAGVFVPDPQLEAARFVTVHFGSDGRYYCFPTCEALRWFTEKKALGGPVSTRHHRTEALLRDVSLLNYWEKREIELDELTKIGIHRRIVPAIRHILSMEENKQFQRSGIMESVLRRVMRSAGVNLRSLLSVRCALQTVFPPPRKEWGDPRLTKLVESFVLQRTKTEANLSSTTTTAAVGDAATQRTMTDEKAQRLIEQALANEEEESPKRGNASSPTRSRSSNIAPNTANPQKTSYNESTRQLMVHALDSILVARTVKALILRSMDAVRRRQEKEQQQQQEPSDDALLTAINAVMIPFLRSEKCLQTQIVPMIQQKFDPPLEEDNNAQGQTRMANSSSSRTLTTPPAKNDDGYEYHDHKSGMDPDRQDHDGPSRTLQIEGKQLDLPFVIQSIAESCGLVFDFSNKKFVGFTAPVLHGDSGRKTMPQPPFGDPSTVLDEILKTLRGGNIFQQQTQQRSFMGLSRTAGDDRARINAVASNGSQNDAQKPRLASLPQLVEMLFAWSFSANMAFFGSPMGVVRNGEITKLILTYVSNLALHYQPKEWGIDHVAFVAIIDELLSDSLGGDTGLAAMNVAAFATIANEALPMRDLCFAPLRFLSDILYLLPRCAALYRSLEPLPEFHVCLRTELLSTWAQSLCSMVPYFSQTAVPSFEQRSVFFHIARSLLTFLPLKDNFAAFQMYSMRDQEIFRVPDPHSFLLALLVSAFKLTEEQYCLSAICSCMISVLPPMHQTLNPYMWEKLLEMATRVLKPGSAYLACILLLLAGYSTIHPTVQGSLSEAAHRIEGVLLDVAKDNEALRLLTDKEVFCALSDGLVLYHFSSIYPTHFCEGLLTSSSTLLSLEIHQRLHLKNDDRTRKVRAASADSRVSSALAPSSSYDGNSKKKTASRLNENSNVPSRPTVECEAVCVRHIAISFLAKNVEASESIRRVVLSEMFLNDLSRFCSQLWRTLMSYTSARAAIQDRNSATQVALRERLQCRSTRLHPLHFDLIESDNAYLTNEVPRQGRIPVTPSTWVLFVQQPRWDSMYHWVERKLRTLMEKESLHRSLVIALAVEVEHLEIIQRFECSGCRLVELQVIKLMFGSERDILFSREGEGGNSAMTTSNSVASPPERRKSIGGGVPTLTRRPTFSSTSPSEPKPFRRTSLWREDL